MEAPLRLIERILGAAVRVAALLGVASLVVLVGLVVVTVTFRAIDIAFPGTYVLQQLMIIPTVSLSLAYAAWKGRHTRVEILTQRFPSRVARPLEALMLVTGSVFWVVVGYAWYLQAVINGRRGEKTPLLDIPVWPFRWLMVGAVILMVVVVFFRALELLMPEKPKESET